MDNFLKVITIVGAGILLGSVAGKFIKTDKIRISRFHRVTEKGLAETVREKMGIPERRIDELENYFI